MPSDELEQLRAAMDVCNARLAAVLHERARLARTIGAWKRARGRGLADPAREASMLAALPTPAGGFDRAALQRIFALVFAESRALLQRELG
ncbi:MAG: chorismate mutase [Planctomycetes bacterium]|nr:chorismate mutase [Planctomycetota bacterium]